MAGLATRVLSTPGFSRSRGDEFALQAVTPVLASRMPTSIARRHWGCSPSSNFPGRLTPFAGPPAFRASSFHPPRRRAALATVLPVVRESAPGTGETHLALRPPGEAPNTGGPSHTAGAPSQQQRRHEYPEDLVEVGPVLVWCTPLRPSIRLARLFSACQGVDWGNFGAIQMQLPLCRNEVRGTMAGRLARSSTTCSR